MRSSSDQIRIGCHVLTKSPITGVGSGGGGGGGGSVSDNTLRMSHIAATRPYIVLLTGDDIDTTSGRQLHIHAIADGS